MNYETLLLVAQAVFLVDLAILAVLDYKFRFAFTLLLVPMWIAAIIAAIPLIGAAYLSYAIELAIITVLLMVAGVFHRLRIGDGDVWILICSVWVFAETPLVLVFSFLLAFVFNFIWARHAKPIEVKIKGEVHKLKGGPFATCMGIAMVIVLPILLALHLMVF